MTMIQNSGGNRQVNDDSRLQSDFQKDGVPASWAEGHPVNWGSEKIKLPLGQDRNQRVSSASVSSDEAFLAVAVDKDIYIYSTDNFEFVETLRGHLQHIDNVEFGGAPDDGEDGYTLASGGSTGGTGRDPLIICWHLDKTGRRKSAERNKIVDIRKVAHSSADVAVESLTALGDWKRDEPAVQTLHDRFHSVLQEADREHTMSNESYSNGSIAIFGSSAFSHDRTKLLKLNEVTDGTGKRYRTTIYDVSTGKDKCHLEGHRDNITWAGFSPNDQLVASAAWDGYLKLYNAETGELIRDFGPTGGQNWVGAFSPDSSLIAVSRGNPESTIYVWRTDDPQAFPTTLQGFMGWSRTMAWSPDGQYLAAGAEGGKLIVFNPHTTATEQVWQLNNTKRYIEVSDVTWLQCGKKLAFKPGDGGFEMYDYGHNKKWGWGPGPNDQCMQGFWAKTIVVINKKGWVGSVDQDGALRFWDLPSSE